MPRDWLKLIQTVVLVLVGCLLIEYALWITWKPKPLLIAAAAAITSYLSLLWAIFKNSPEGWLQAGFRWVFRLVLSTLRRAICSLVVSATTVVLLGLLLFNTWRAETRITSQPNYIVQLFHTNAINPAVDAMVKLHDPFSSAPTVEDSTDSEGRAFFKLENGQLRQISIAIVKDQAQIMTLLPVERIESLPNSKAIDLDAITVTAWRAITSNQSQPLFEFASANKESVEQYLSSFGPDVQIKGERRFLSLHLPFGIPKAKVIVSRQQYALGFDPVRHIPRWAAYRINTGKERYRRELDQFLPDPLIPEEDQASPEDYAKNPYDRGHLVSRHDVGGYGENPQYIVSYMSAVAPQIEQLNRGVWTHLEEYGRQQSEYGEIWIITGPAFVPPSGDKNITYAVIGENVAVPTHFFRIIVRRNLDLTVQTVAFLVPNTSDVTGPFEKFLTSIDTIEGITGLDFFDAQSHKDQEQIESTAGRLL